MHPSHPIGLFDSGVGGLTVMKEIASLLPHENLIYLADTAHLPYGDKSPQAIIQYTLENTAFLLQQKIKLLIIACHTASSYGLKFVQERYSFPVFGLIKATFDQCIELKKKEKILILGTTNTIQSKTYQSLIQQHDPNIKIFSMACPLFVPLIEEARLDLEAAKTLAHHYLDPFKKENIDAALLACTHYPLIQSTIQEVLGPEVTLINPAKRLASQIHQSLSEQALLNPQMTRPVYQYYTTGHPQKFSQLSRVFFKHGIGRKRLRKIRIHENIVN
jgi:glutamate racemase